MIRLIASDLDETLLDSSHRICERNRRAVAAARELGVRFVPCTGRPGDSVAGDLEVLGLAGRRGEYVISFNGGVITENCGGPALRTARLDHARAVTSDLSADGAQRFAQVVVGGNAIRR